MSASNALSAVVDTNVFVSGVISAGGPPGRLLDFWYAGRFELLLSDRQYVELIDVFNRRNLFRTYPSATTRLNRLLSELAIATSVDPHPDVPVAVRDPKDEHILASALGRADYLVTGDQDLLVHRDDPRLGSLRIVTAAEFLAIVNEPAGGRAKPPPSPTADS